MLKKDPKLGLKLVVASLVLFVVGISLDWIFIGAIISPIMLGYGVLKIIMPRQKEKPVASYVSSPLNRITSTPSLKPIVKSEDTRRATIKSYVTGLNYEGRQKIISDWKAESYEPYNGMTQKEIREEGDGTYYKYPKDYEVDAITFELDPTNQYDSNAVRAIHDSMGFIGFLPKDDNVRMKKLIESGAAYSVESEIYGGQYKEVNDEDVEANNEPFHISLRIFKS